MEDTSMKIALCLHGYFNSSKDQSSSGIDGAHHIKKHILENNDVDVYVHSWDLENEQVIHNLYGDQIVSHLFENQIDFQSIYLQNRLNLFPVHGDRPFWTAFSQYYSVQRSFQLMLDSNIEYDCVIKSRFDLGRINRNTTGPGMQNPYPVQCINFDKNLDMSKFYMANWQYLDTEGPADMWFYSNKQNMSHFAKVYDILSTDIRHSSDYHEWASSTDGGVVNVIKGWKWFLMKSGLWDKKETLETEWE